MSPQNSNPGLQQAAHASTRSSTQRVVLLTNFIPPYLYRVFRLLSREFDRFAILLSTLTEANRPWQPVSDGLEVQLQRSFSLNSRQKHPQGFTSDIERHFPYDTLPRLILLRPDIVISVQLGFRTAQSVLYRLLFRKSRLIIWVDGSEHTEKRIRRLQTFLRRLLLRHADAVLVIGKSGKRYLEKIGVPSDRIVDVPYVADDEIFKGACPYRSTEIAYRLLYVGQLIELKGLSQFLLGLVEWAEKHPSRSCELWFVGDGPLRETLERVERPQNLSLTFFGNVPYSALPHFYAEAGICVLPTLADTWALVVNEALASGVPVLGSLYSQAVEHLIRDGENGWTYHPDKTGETQRILDRVFSTEPEVLARMRHVAMESVARLTPEFVADRFLKVIALARKKPAALRPRPIESATEKP